jgi:hypothetical protein
MSDAGQRPETTFGIFGAVAKQARKPPAGGEEIGNIGFGARKGGSRSWAERRWHAFGANPYPKDQKRFGVDLPGLIRESVLVGHRPEQGMLTMDDSVITLGSCFATHLREVLSGAGLTGKSFFVPSGLNNTFAILDFVSWCVTGRETDRGFRYDRMDDGAIREWKPEEERERYLEGLREAGAFVLTIGLAEVWQDRETGGVFWRGVPREIFKAERHLFRLSSVDENEANLLRVIELVRAVNPQAPIVLTLSPVPLKATFRDIACVSADCVSKSTLRVALDRVTSHGLENVYYWPSFEIVRWVGANLPYSAYGDDGSSRHVRDYLVREIIDAFVEAFWVPEAAAQLRPFVMTRNPEPVASSS